MKFHDYAGVIHFHSGLSFDGRDPVPKILEAAGRNDLDFLVLTDHDHLKAREAGFEGWHGRVLLVVGQEVCPGQFNHYLALGISEPVDDCHGKVSPQAVIYKVREKGGFGFIAHPDHEGTEMFHVKPYPWTDWTVSGYCGLGIWDFMTDWQSSLTGYVRAVLSYLFPALYLRGPRPVTLRRWDDLNRETRVVGIGELDNHNTRKKLFGIGLDVFPFRKAFRFIRTHVLTESPLAKDPDEARDALFAALKAGRVYVAQEYFGGARGFSFVIDNGKEKATMGDEIALKPGSLLKARLPGRGKIRVVKDGVFFKEAADALECSVIEKGVYRAEAYLHVLGRYRPWIFSNPVYVR